MLLVKLENDVARPSKTIFYCRFVDDIYNRLKLGDNVLFDQLNSYYPNIYLTLEVNPSKFLDTNSQTSMVPVNSTVMGKTQNYLQHGSPKLQSAINEIQSMVIIIVQKEYHQTFSCKVFPSKSMILLLLLAIFSKNKIIFLKKSKKIVHLLGYFSRFQQQFHKLISGF